MTDGTSSIMLRVAGALVPGLATLTWFFGPGIVANVVVCVAAAVATEVVALHLRRAPPIALGNGSAVVTGALLGLCLPPFLPLWMAVAGTAFAMLFGKHLYGGLGHNPFNPAMVGYAMLIVAFPLAMSLWPVPAGDIGWYDTLSYKLGASVADGVTMATPLDAFEFRGGATVEEYRQTAAAIRGGDAWRWINLAFLAGGIYLVYRGICHWRMPLTMLASLAVLGLVFYDSGSSDSLGSPLLHLFGGSTMLAAFFILTDPVTSPDNVNGQLVFAAGAAVLIFTIRSIGAYPDGIAFAILLMNATAPLIEQVRWRYA